MSWQIAKASLFSGENKEAFAIWMAEVSKLIKSIDRNHLVPIGSEGKYDYEEDISLFERIHTDAKDADFKKCDHLSD